MCCIDDERIVTKIAYSVTNLGPVFLRNKRNSKAPLTSDRCSASNPCPAAFFLPYLCSLAVYVGPIWFGNVRRKLHTRSLDKAYSSSSRKTSAVSLQFKLLAQVARKIGTSTCARSCHRPKEMFGGYPTVLAVDSSHGVNQEESVFTN